MRSPFRHQEEQLPTVSSALRNFLLIACAVCSLGCGSDPGISPSTKAEPAEISMPDVTVASRVALIIESRRVQVGDLNKTALAAVPEPPRALQVIDRPQGLDNRFRVSGWQSGAKGFGLVLADDRVLAAVYQNEASNTEEIQTVTETHAKLFDGQPPEQVGQGAAKYLFWEDGPHRLMILSVQRSDGEISLTVAMGDQKVLGLLGASVSRARLESRQADAILLKRNEEKPTP